MTLTWGSLAEKLPLWWDLQNEWARACHRLLVTSSLCMWRRTPGADVSGRRVRMTRSRGGGGQCQGSRVTPSPESPACCDDSFQRLYFPRQECPSLSYSEQSRKPIIRKECSEGGDFHFSCDNLGIYCSKSTIWERDAFFFFFSCFNPLLFKI